MKKYIVTLFIASISLTHNSYGCTNPTGNVISGTNSNYNCHQYVRAALINNWVNMTTGFPSNQTSIPGLSNYTIESDNDFIRVCSTGDAKAISVIGSDHAAVVLNGGFYSADYGDFASTPGVGSYVYRHGHARSSTTACSHKLYATTTGISISGPSSLAAGSIVTYTLNNLPAYILFDLSRWMVSSNLSVISSSNTSITVKAINAGSAYVKASLSTSCIGSGEFKPVKTKSITVPSNCGGTLNGGSLNTFNYVGYGSSNTVAMNASNWTWVKTSGSTSYWYTGSSGKYMYFSIPNGCATFNAYGSGCNITVTFCASGGSYSMQSSPNESQLEYSVLNVQTGRVAKTGLISDPDDTKTMIDGLSTGFYVISVNGKRKKIIVR